MEQAVAVLVAVVFGILLSLGAFYLVTTDVFYALQYLAARFTVVAQRAVPSVLEKASSITGADRRESARPVASTKLSLVLAPALRK